MTGGPPQIKREVPSATTKITRAVVKRRTVPLVGLPVLVAVTLCGGGWCVDSGSALAEQTTAANQTEVADLSFNAPASRKPLPTGRRDYHHVDGPVRHDISGLRAFVPRLPEAASVSWVIGRRGDDSVPGPSMYELIAVVNLNPDVARGLRARLLPVRSSSTVPTPDVPRQLRADLPSGAFLTSTALEERVRRDVTRGLVSAAMSRTEDVLVIVCHRDRPFGT
ncbi:hypothetical protein [Austwickia sp. TVS 96-490-7B]|uniref:hypothetical protein n=1 Tax=Austwickia sp. TVS 96-490-7B TaxID=2830843 RepID=UPI001C57C0D4|nr:hypothetical protein [Austwickia sp. TVS 96-490-7B]